MCFKKIICKRKPSFKGETLLFTMNLIISGIACRPATYGFPNIVALVQSLGDLVVVRGRGVKRILLLSQDFAPPSQFSSTTVSWYVL